MTRLNLDERIENVLITFDFLPILVFLAKHKFLALIEFGKGLVLGVDHDWAEKVPRACFYSLWLLLLSYR